MSDKTKSCNLTEREVRQLIGNYGTIITDPEENDSIDYQIERINYLHKRLKAFKEPEIVSNNSAAGWGNAPATSTAEGE